MAWKYNPKDAESCLPEGEYEATVNSVTEGESKTSGNPMLTVGFAVYPPAGGERKVNDYIVNPSTLFKMKKIARALGEEDDFKAGTFDLADHIGANLTLVLDVQQQDGFDDKNNVKDYKPLARRTVASGTRKAAPAETIEDKDIPF